MASYLDKAGLSSVWSKMKDKMYPVGSIYISTDSTSPASIYGGTWERIEGRFLLGASGDYEVGETGGEETHQLTIDEMPSHTHYPPDATVYGGNAGFHRILFATNSPLWSTGDQNNAVTSTGGDTPHNNMPPYVVVYMWERIA